MRPHWIILAALALSHLAAAAPDTERQAKLWFEERYGPVLRKAAASKPTDDDVALAKELAALARASADQPARLNELCDAAFMLASRDPAAHELAVEVMEILAAAMPDSAASARERALAMLRRQYAAARGAEQAPAGQRLVDHLTRLASQLAEASDHGGAARLYQQAVKVADEMRLPTLAALKGKYEAAAHRESIEQRIEAAMKKLAADPASPLVNAELLQIYLIELDSPQQAAQYARHAGNEKATRLLPLVAGKADELAAAQCIELAEWYESLVQAASNSAKAAMLRRAMSFYETYMLSEGVDNLQMARVQLTLARLRQSWAKLEPDKAAQQPPSDDAGWTDALVDVDLARHRQSGQWSRGTGYIENARTADPARLMLAAVPPDSYEVTASFTRVEGSGPVVFILPVGDKAARFVLAGLGPSSGVDGSAGKSSGIYHIAGETVDPDTGHTRNASTVAAGEIEDLVRHQLSARVILRGEKAAISIDYDGKRLTQWSGPRGDLSAGPDWALREPAAIGIAAQHARVHWHSAKVRSLRGDLVRMAKPPTVRDRGVIEPIDGYVNLIDLWEAGKDVVVGDWSRGGNGIAADAGKRDETRTSFPVNVAGDYVVRVRYRFNDPHRGGSPILHLPVAGGEVILATQQQKNGSFLFMLRSVDRGDWIDARTYTDDAEKAPSKELKDLKDPKDPKEPKASKESDKPFEKEETTPKGGKVKKPAAPEGSLDEGLHELVVRVSHKGEDAAIEADLDGRPALRWKGPAASLSLPVARSFGDTLAVGVGVASGHVTFERVELKVLSSRATITRKAVVTAVAATDTTPVDLLKVIDAKKHAVAGAWQVVDGRLSTTITAAKGSATLAAPAQPEGAYEVKVKFVRAVGRPVIYVHVPIGGSAAEIVFGDNEGKTCYIALESKIAPPPGSITSAESIRLVPATPFTARIRVEPQGANVDIRVELEGKPYLSFKGSKSSLARPNMNIGSGRSPTLSVVNTALRTVVTFAELEIRMLQGTMKRGDP